MHIETIHEIFFEAIYKTNKIAIKNAGQPLLQYIHLQLIDETTLRISAYNMDVYIYQDIFVKIINKDIENKSIFNKNICIDANIVISFLSLFEKNQNICIKINDNNLEIEIAGQISKYNIIEGREYPKNPVNEFLTKNNMKPNKGIKLASEMIIEGVQAVSFASAITSIKPELSCVSIVIDDIQKEITFAATDGFRLAEKKIYIKGNYLQESNIDSIELYKQILIPNKIWQDCLKVIQNNVTITLTLYIGYAVIEYAEGSIILRTIQGVYPNYKAIFPTVFSTGFEIETSEFIQSLKQSQIFSDEFHYVKLEINEDNLISSTKNIHKGESFSKKEIVKTGENIIQTYNYRYISDFIQKVKTDYVIFNISGKTTPTIIQGKNDNSYTYFVAPMNK